MLEKKYYELETPGVQTNAPTMLVEIKSVLADLASANNARGNMVVEATFKLSEPQVMCLFNIPLWLAELNTLHYSYFFTTPMCDGEYLLKVLWSEKRFANTDDLRVIKLVVSSLGLSAKEVESTKWEDVGIYTPDQFVDTAWYLAEDHFLAMPEVEKEYHKKFNKIVMRRFLLDENIKSVSNDMLEEYWLEKYGVRDIEELRTDIRKVKLAENECLTTFDGETFVVSWAVKP